MSQRPSRQLPRSWRQLRARLEFLGIFLIVIWLAVLLDLLVPGLHVTQWGLQPRTLRGLIGIPLAPFLHSGISHVGANTLPLIVLGTLLLIRSVGDFLRVTVIVILVSGLAVWLVGRGESVHLGASGLVLGYFGCLLMLAYLERTPASLLLAALVVLVYGGLLWGLLPQDESVSWEYHLCGFLSGVLAALLLTCRSNKLKEAADR